MTDIFWSNLMTDIICLRSIVSVKNLQVSSVVSQLFQLLSSVCYYFEYICFRKKSVSFWTLHTISFYFSQFRSNSFALILRVFNFFEHDCPFMIFFLVFCRIIPLLTSSIQIWQIQLKNEIYFKMIIITLLTSAIQKCSIQSRTYNSTYLNFSVYSFLF